MVQNDSVYCSHIALSPNGEDIVISTDRDAFIFNANTLDRKCTLPPIHTGYISSLCYSPDGKYIISASWDRTVCMWNAQNGSWVKTFRGAEIGLRSCSMSPDGNYILATSENAEERKKKIFIWNTRTSAIVEQLKSEAEYSFCQDIPSMMISNGASGGFLDFPSIDELVIYFRDCRQ